MFATPPVILNGVDIFDDGWIQASVEGVRGMGFTGFGFEEVLDPTGIKDVVFEVCMTEG